MNKKSVVFAAVCAIFISLGFSKDVKPKSVRTPGKNQVILTGKVSLKNPIDMEARKDLYRLNRNKTPVHAYSVDVKQGKRKHKTAYYFEFGENFYIVVDAKDDTIELEKITGYLFHPYDHDENFFMPFNFTVTIPEGEQYIYLGDFEIELDYALRTVNMERTENWDEAEEKLCRALGKEVSMVRGELSVTEEE